MITLRLTPDEERFSQLWDWISVALFVLVPVDMLTTMYAAHRFGVASEINPVMRWALSNGLATVVILNLLALIIVVLLFHALVWVLNELRSPWQVPVTLLAETWLGLLIAVGLGIFANNLSVIVFGQSLL